MVAKIEQLKKSQLFSGLPDADLRKIADISNIKKFSDGEMLFSQGDVAGGFYIITAGAVRIFQLSAGGKEHLLHIFYAGEAFAEAAALGCGIFPACAEAIEDSELVFVPAGGFRKILSENPALAINIIGKLSSLLHMFVEKIEALTLKDAGTRLAEYLLKLSKGLGPKVKIELPIKKTALASQLNMTQETFSRVLAKLRALKIIKVSGGTIIIENIHTLQELTTGHGANG